MIDRLDLLLRIAVKKSLPNREGLCTIIGL